MEKKMDEAEKCVICLYEKKDPVILNCGHSICSPCMDNFLSNTYRGLSWKCMLCRAPIEYKVENIQLKAQNKEKTYGVRYDIENGTTQVQNLFRFLSTIPRGTNFNQIIRNIFLQDNISFNNFSIQAGRLDQHLSLYNIVSGATDLCLHFNIFEWLKNTNRITTAPMQQEHHGNGNDPEASVSATAVVANTNRMYHPDADLLAVYMRHGYIHTNNINGRDILAEPGNEFVGRRNFNAVNELNDFNVQNAQNANDAAAIAALNAPINPFDDRDIRMQEMMRLMGEDILDNSFVSFLRQ